MKIAIPLLTAGLALLGCAPSSTEKPADAGTVSDLTAGCERGDMPSCTLLGNLYLAGDGVPRDAARARALFEQACKGGETVGCHNFGLTHLKNQGGPSDRKVAAASFKKACNGGYSNACEALLGIEVGFREEIGETLTTATLEKACRATGTASCVRLGMMTLAGQGVALDPARASKLFADACDRDFAWGCLMLGGQYRTGIGVTLDRAKGTRLAEKACTLGLPDACKAL